MQNILIIVAKLRGCIQQFENINPSGAFEQDIVSTLYICVIYLSKYVLLHVNQQFNFN